MRILAGKQAESFVRKLETRGATDLARVEKQVRKIVADVRKNGDRALRRYAQQWDGLSGRQPLRVSADEMQQAWESTRSEFRTALETAAANAGVSRVRIGPLGSVSGGDVDVGGPVRRSCGLR